MRSFLLSVVLFCCAVAPVAAAERLFVFSAGPGADIYDGQTLNLLGSADVGSGGVHAIGVPQPGNPAQFLKFFVFNEDTVYVVSPTAPFDVLGRWPLAARITRGAQGAQLTPDGRWLLVGADEFLFVFDADAPGNPAPISIEMGTPITGFGILPDSTRAFLTVEGSLNFTQIGLDSAVPQRLAGPVELPVIPLHSTVAPNAAAALAVQAGSVTAVDPYANEVLDEVMIGSGSPAQLGFDNDAPLDEMFVSTGTSISILNLESLTFDYFFSPPIAMRKVVSPRSDLLYLLSAASQQVFSSNRDGTDFDLLRDPATNTPFTALAVDIALNRSHTALFVASTGPNSLMRLSAEADAIQAQISLPQAPTAITAVENPGVFTSELQVYGGEGQAGTPNEPLPRRLAVRAVDSQGRGVMGQTVSFFSFASNTTFKPQTIVTNADGVATTEVIVPTDEVFDVEARTDTGLTRRFTLNTGITGGRGLEVLSGDYQITGANTNFPRPTVIRTLTGGVPVADNELTITPDDPSVICPNTATTGEDGVATFQCSAGSTFSEFPKAVRVEVSDELGRRLEEDLFFTVVTDLQQLPRAPINVEPNTTAEIVGPAGEVVEDAMRMRLIRISGLNSVSNVGVEFESSRSEMQFIPRIPFSDFTGRLSAGIRFPCRVGRGSITASVNEPNLAEEEFTFRIVPSAPAAMARIQGNGQSGDANEVLNGPGQALVARVSDRCGNAVPNVPVTWEVSPPGAVVLQNPFASTNGEGLASTIVRLGGSPGAAAVTVRAGEAFATFDLDINVTPTQLLSAAGDLQQISAGAIADMPLTAELLNDLGAGAEGIDVEWAVVQGSGSFPDGPMSITDELGRASTRIRAGATLGPLVVEARAAGFTTSFTLTIVGRVPVVSSVGIVNAASGVVGMTPGSAASIFGVGLMEGVDGVIPAAGAPFPTTFRGVRVLVDGVAAPILALAKVNGQEQINIQVPFFTIAPSNTTVVTVVNNGVSATFTGLRTFEAQPGIFGIASQQGPVVAALHADFSLVTQANPARVGETILVFWTGGGPIDPPLPTNTPGGVNPLSYTVNPPAILLDDQVQNVVASVYAPGLVTAYQANVEISATRSGLLAMSITVLGQKSLDLPLPTAQ